MRAALAFVIGCSVLSQPATAQEQAQPVAKQTKLAEIDVTGSVSPDGRLLSYVDWTSGDLAVRDLQTGEDRRLTNKGSWLESDEFALFSVISPDGKQVAYAWYNRDGSWDLRVVGLDGSEPRVLYRDERVPYVEPRDWSPDGRHVLALFQGRDRDQRIVLVAVAEGSVRVLKALGPHYPRKITFSPDGRFVLYDARPKEDSPNRDIFLLSIEARREVPFIQHPANDLLLGWSPDGNWVLFASDRSGTLDAWIVRVADGRPQDAPVLVERDIGTGPIAGLGLTRNGSYYYGTVTWTTALYVAALDPETGQLSSPQKLASDLDFNTSPDWSPDGRYLAYVSYRGAGASPWDDPYSQAMVILSAESGEERELPLNLTRFGGHAFDVRWSPEGRSVLAQARDDRGREGFYRIDTRTRAVTPVVQSELCPPDCVEWVAWSGARKLVFTRWTADGRALVARDLASGAEKQLHRVARPSSIGPLAVARDGRQVAFVQLDFAARSSALMVMPVAGGEARELLRVRLPERISQLAWTHDGRDFLFGKGRLRDGNPGFELWKVRAEGGEPEPLGLAMEGLNLYGLSVHPDGRRIAFTAGTARRDEVWVLENALPTQAP